MEGIYKRLLILFGMISIVACSKAPKNSNRVLDVDEVALLSKLPVLSKERGETLLKTHCYSCHNPQSSSHDNMLAPPLAGIKHKYKQLYPERSMFIAQVADFIRLPSKENAVMKGPVRRFGLMPKTTLPEENIAELIAFIYDNQLDAPDWFPDHFEEQHGINWADR